MAGFQLNCRSKPENHFSRYNKIIKFGAASKEATNQESSSSGNVDYSALKLISDFLMEDEEEEEDLDKACMVHDSLALQATEKSFYDALHNINPDQNTLLISPIHEGRCFDPFHMYSYNNFDYFPSHYHDSEQNNEKIVAGDDCVKMVNKKQHVAETLDDLFCINGESEEQSQDKKKWSRR